MKLNRLWLISVFSVMLVRGTPAGAADLTVVYNNVPGKGGLTTAWGLSYFVRQGGHEILFDTGGSSSLFLENLRILGLNPDDVDAVVLSHYHHDHVGGLAAVMRSGLEIYVPHTFPAEYKEGLRRQGATVIEVTGPHRIRDGFVTTGVIDGSIPEQALLITTDRGTVVVTGCSHPGVVKMCRRAREIIPDKLYLVTGGFHLGGESAGTVRRIIAELKILGVEKIAPNHCTGREAMRMFEDAWEEGYIHLGAGDSLIIEKQDGRVQSE